MDDRAGRMAGATEVANVPAEATVGPVLIFDQVVKRYRGNAGLFNAVDRVSFSVEANDRLAIIGESGSGKSTTARMILGLIGRDAGRLRVLGSDWSEIDRSATAKLRGRIGAVFQEPVDSLDPTMNVATIVAEPLVVHRKDLARSEVEARVELSVGRVGLSTSLLRRKPGQLSGGQAQRVSIARALINGPELLVLDEPTSALDLSVQAQILELLENVAEQDQLTWVFITHDLSVAKGVCETVIVMQKGRVVEKGRCVAVLESPEHIYTKELVASSLLV